MGTPLLLGIDVGTSNVKVIAFDQDGRARARASRPTPTKHEGRGRAVHDAEELWGVVSELLREVVAGLAAPVDVAGVAVASMGEEGFPLDGQGQVLCPGILWHDERTRELTSEWEARVGRTRLYQLTGLPAHHMFTALKLQWLVRHQPEVMRRAAHWLWVGDYMAYRLSGAMATTPSLASRTMLYDLRGGRWCRELVETAGIDPGLMPPIADSGTVVGAVTTEAARQTGLPAGTPVVAGGHDHICGCLACGAIEPGDVVDSGGTAEALTKIVGRTDLDALLTQGGGPACGAHVVSGRYYALGTRHTGAVIAWWERLLAGRDEDRSILGEAERSPRGANGLLFVPYMFGKDIPDADPAATGALVGLHADHSRGDVMRAVIEGVCYDTVALHRLLVQVGGGEQSHVTAIGGLVRNRLWLRLKAEVIGVTVRVPEQEEAVAQGAALLAGLGTGVYEGAPSMMMRTLRYEETIEPDAEAIEAYRRLYEKAYLPTERLARGRAGGSTPP